MNMHEHDDDFDLRLSKRERLLPQFDAELDGPDADTDRVLIARARRAAPPVQLRAAASKPFRSPRWAVPVGLAATLVLSFTLLLHTSPPQVAQPVSAPMASQAVSDSTARESAMSDAPLRESTVGGAAGGASAPATMNRALSGRAAVSEIQEEIAIQPSVVVKAMPAPSMPAQASSPPPPLPAMTAAGAADSASLQRRESTVSALASADAERAAADAVAAAESAADISTERPAGAPLDPEVWLRRVERLKSRGFDAEARRELLDFRQQYPDHPLPAALQALLPAP